MGLLDGGLKGVFGTVFGSILPAGTLHIPTNTPDGKGGYTQSYSDTPIKAMRENYSTSYRQNNGIPDTDVKIIVLQQGVAATPDTDHEITAMGIRYRVIGPVTQDPASASWEIRGRPIAS